MIETRYEQLANSLKTRIYENQFETRKLPNERALAEEYNVSRQTVKKALNLLSNQGMVIKKAGSGNYINPWFLKNKANFQYNGSNVGITDTFSVGDEKPSVVLLDFQVHEASKDQQEGLFLDKGEYVYQFKRLRKLNDIPFMIEEGIIPTKLLPELTEHAANESIFSYLEKVKGRRVPKAFISIEIEPSNSIDKKLLKLTDVEPVGIMSGIFFLDDGTPFELSTMRLHYKYLHYNTLISLDSE